MMNWLKERDTLFPKCQDFKNFGNTNKLSKQNKTNILNNNNFSCRYCGGIYTKYLIGCYISEINDHDVSCRACYVITHLNWGMFKELKLYYSKLSQVEIVKKTVDYIINNNEIPSPNIIDPLLKTVPISILEFVNIINNYSEIPQPFDNYKLFFSSKFNIDFIVNNYGNKMFNFVDPQNDTDEKNIKLDNTIKKHICDKEEINLINKHYSQYN